MKKRDRTEFKLIRLEGIMPDDRVEAIKIPSDLEDVQGCRVINDDIIELVAKQNEAVEVIIQKLIMAGVIYG